MIRPINIKLNAAHPELPLVEATTFTGAPSSVFIRGVPKAVGNWSITAVSVAVTFPDNTTTARAAVESAEGVWVATIPGTATSGRTAAGFKIMADGIDENGDAVTGYVLGFADFSVLSFTPVPAPGGTFYLLRYFDQAPATPKEGDVAKIDGVLKLYNGTAWEAFAASPTLDDAVTRTSANGVKSSGIWSAIWGTATTAFSSLYDWCVSQLAGKASTADATLTEKWTPTISLTDAQKAAFSLTPGASDNDYALTIIVPSSSTDSYSLRVGSYSAAILRKDPSNSTNLIFYAGDARLELQAGDLVATLSGYQLGSQADKPLASEAEAEALRTEVAGKLGNSGDQTITSGTQAIGFGFNAMTPWIKFTDGNGNTIYAYQPSASGSIALTAGVGHSGNLAALDANGNPTDSQIPAANVALKGNIPYSLGTLTVIDTASSEVVEGETVYYGAATLADRTANIVQVTAATALDELRITFPAATSGKVRDFGLRVEIGTGSAALAAPALVPVAPTGETIKIENADRAIPELADGTATAKGVTLLYFSENAPGVFVVKGEQVEEVA